MPQVGGLDIRDLRKAGGGRADFAERRALAGRRAAHLEYGRSRRRGRRYVKYAWSANTAPGAGGPARRGIRRRAAVAPAR